eukprot:Platyproteum_vivax@DN1432_c0_g1_i1.p1
MGTETTDKKTDKKIKKADGSPADRGSHIKWGSRVLTGLVGVPLVLYAITNSYIFLLLCIGVIIVGCIEFSIIRDRILSFTFDKFDKLPTKKLDKVFSNPTVLSVVASSKILVAFYCSRVTPYFCAAVMSLLFLSCFYSVCIYLANFSASEDATPLAYLILHMSLDLHYFVMYSLPGCTTVFLTMAYVRLFLFCSWQADTGALIVGSRYGKTKLAPALSPKKSWEGVGGAFLLSFLTAAFVWLLDYIGVPGLPKCGFWHYTALSIIIALLGVIGDLIESALKRAGRVKDSSHMFPGHGGMLDRLDSLTVAAPAVWAYVCFFNLS